MARTARRGAECIRGHARQFLSGLAELRAYKSLRSLLDFKMETYRGWKRRIAVIFYIITFMTFVSLRYRTHETSILIMLVHIQLVSVERLVFDVFGQMWGTMLLNGLSTISLLAGLLAVCAAEKLAIALVCIQ